ncbi:MULTISPECIES: hypothetical protein [Novosphingobium]|uniref:Phage shock protein B n=2 Tax=Novosphingobium TaxID=165696 RepID=A0ABT0AG00_9SPHN|nr:MULTISPECIES: hypothetical protein [Novosphingobium]MED5543994.1 hypothetical protein [Pseudomonadota bacterium]MCJ1962096.1 hypothetical protein [Novosphingobium mangrovi (ex Hu et al. 2023)]QVM84098.1 hypothetical protein HT578_10725 [Novosphingobium decolorationis]TYC91858.1 hypothetical protein FMM79_04215 [Novosphingobium sp. BW1]GAM05045.1 hypothetical conserved protein [Novosphingobium sp. MBES04]
MSFWTAVVVMFVIGCITWLRAKKLHLPSERSDHGRTIGRRDPHEQELEDEIAQLRERINVLERIATDERRGKDLAKEIESLRD